MIIPIIETILGLILLKISIQSLKKSVIRKWKEGFYITLITSIVIICHGLTGLIINIPSEINNLLFFLICSSMMIALFRISKMKGLTA